MTGNSWIFLYMKILESAAILPASGSTGALSGKEGQVRWGESAECSGRHLLRLAGGWRGDVVVCPIDIRFPFHLFASFCAYARPARLMRILQPQPESGPSFFFSFFCFVFHVFSCFISFSHYVNLSIFIFFILQSCVILICLSCFPHVCSYY
jgi:hypothetical protein